jgi:hypothetical protein
MRKNDVLIWKFDDELIWKIEVPYGDVPENQFS